MTNIRVFYRIERGKITKIVAINTNRLNNVMAYKSKNSITREIPIYLYNTKKFSYQEIVYRIYYDYSPRDLYLVWLYLMINKNVNFLN